MTIKDYNVGSRVVTAWFEYNDVKYVVDIQTANASNLIEKIIENKSDWKKY